MPETNTHTSSAADAAGVSHDDDQNRNSEPSFTQADIDRIVKERLSRQAEKYADYNELKTKAAKLDEAEQAKKTELEKAQEARIKLEQELHALRLSQLRSQVAAEKGLPADAVRFLPGTTREELEQAAEVLAKLVTVPSKSALPSDPRFGTQISQSPNLDKTQIKEFFSS